MNKNYRHSKLSLNKGMTRSSAQWSGVLALSMVVTSGLVGCAKSTKVFKLSSPAALKSVKIFGANTREMASTSVLIASDVEAQVAPAPETSSSPSASPSPEPSASPSVTPTPSASPTDEPVVVIDPPVVDLPPGTLEVPAPISPQCGTHMEATTATVMDRFNGERAVHVRVYAPAAVVTVPPSYVEITPPTPNWGISPQDLAAYFLSRYNPAGPGVRAPVEFAFPDNLADGSDYHLVLCNAHAANPDRAELCTVGSSILSAKRIQRGQGGTLLTDKTFTVANGVPVIPPIRLLVAGSVNPAAPPAYCSAVVDPLMLDIVHNQAEARIDLSSSLDGADFNIQGGPLNAKSRISWPKDTKEAPLTPFLALPVGSDCLPYFGKDCNVYNINQLFGDNTEGPNGETAADGFAALAKWDAKGRLGGNGDGKITSKDEIYPSLRLWYDFNRDGISSINELIPLSDKGVIAIDLNFVVKTEADIYGNLTGNRASVVVKNGNDLQNKMIFDIWFKIF